VNGDAPICPGCREDRLIELDTALQVFVCGVCARQWRPRPSTPWTESVDRDVAQLARMRLTRVFQ
jgi:hypothetical protein